LRHGAPRWALVAVLGSVIAGCSSFSGTLGHLGKATGLVPDQTTQSAQIANLLKDGDAAREKGDLEGAEKDYVQAVAFDPKSLDAQLRLGAVRLARKDNAGAFAAYQTAQSLAPKDAEAAFRLGEIDLTHGKAKDASDEFAIALETRKDDPKLYNAIGVALNMQGNFDLAKENYDKGLAIEPDYPALRNNYGLLQLETGDLPGAFETFSALVSSPQATDRYRLNRALVELAMGQTAAALADAPNMDEPGLRQSLATYLTPPSDDPAATTVGNGSSPQAVHLAVNPQPKIVKSPAKTAESTDPLAALPQTATP
jgi:Flp pilus assembly protein TadD